MPTVLGTADGLWGRHLFSCVTRIRTGAGWDYAAYAWTDGL